MYPPGPSLPLVSAPLVRYHRLGDPDRTVLASRRGSWVPPVGTPVVLVSGPAPGDYVVHTVADRPDDAPGGLVVVWLVAP